MGRRTIAFIPARGGSKSIPHKNIKEFCGKPLIYWSLLAAEQSTAINKIIVSTDCDKIEETVKGFNFFKTVVYRRLPENASDTASTESAMLEYIKAENLADETHFFLIQLTTPFTTSSDLDMAFQRYQTRNIDSVLSCVRVKRFFWNEEGTSTNYDFKNRPRRQDFNGNLMENGAFYISSVKNIKQTKNRLSGKIAVFEMPEYTAVEIDEEHDWLVAETIMKKYVLKKNEHVSIKLFLTDVDGVLTDAGMYYSDKGEIMKKFNTKDGMGIKLLKENGIKTGIITGENSQIVKRRAEKLGIDYVFLGIKDKLPIAQSICDQEEIELKDVAYIGDDINDIELLQSVGISACPADAMKQVKPIQGISVLQRKGGDGAVREFIERIL